MNTRDKRKKTNSKKAVSKKPASQRPVSRSSGSRSGSGTRSSSARSRRRQQERRKQQQIRYLLQGLFLGFCIALLIFSVWKLASIFLGYRSGEKEYDDLRQYVLEEPIDPAAVTPAEPDDTSGEGSEEGTESPAPLVPMQRIDLASLQEINSDATGWIEIPGTALSYPLVHTSDNIYYLTHTFRREENRSGSIFTETSNSADFSDLHTIVYGHNMKDGSMFASLKNYKKDSYFKAHPYIYIDLADGAHCYQIFSCHDAAVTDITYTIGYSANDQYASFLDALKSASLYDTGVDVGIQDSVITLSTCTNDGKDRFVVHAKKLY